MRSRAEPFLRGAALLTLAVLCLRVATGPGNATLSVTSAGVPRALPPATVRPLARLYLRASVLPDARERAWLRALARTGTTVTWSGPGERAGGALTIEPLRAPGGRSIITVAAAADSAIRLVDASGELATLRPGEGGAAAMVAVADGVVGGRFATGEALSARRDSVAMLPVLVIGRAGWEAKFVTATLEEAGWAVDARLAVAPGVFVTQGRNGPGTPDTSRYAAVVMLDSARTAVDGSIRAYVASGGGLVVAHDAAQRAELLQLAGVSAGKPLRGEVGALEGSDPRAGLRAVHLAAREPAVALDRRGDVPTVVARRLGAGRVILSGYSDTWRWRMSGNESAPRDHREWWSRLVAAAAHARFVSLQPGRGFDEAPLAASFDALGPPTGPAEAGGLPVPPWLDAVLAALALALLVAEWALRRWRGAP